MEVMLFGVKNGPPTYQKVVTKTFRKYLDNFMKIFLDDFIVYTYMESHFQKLKLCFQMCKEYGISLNPNKCVFKVFSGMILRFIISKERKLPCPKKIQAIVTCHHLRIHNIIFKYTMGWHNYKCFIKKIATIIAPITKLTKKTKTFLWIEEC